MQYFGVPRCPYCKKRVNLIRTWSLKRQGEYRCPRCGGISNIFLSPLVYVFALLAVFAGGAIYFFHRFVLDDVDLFTCLQVLLPCALFFLLSLFMVYLAKPVIKRVPREEEKRGRRAPEPRRPGESRAFVDGGEYQSREASVPLQEAVPVSRPQAVESRAQQTAVLPSPARTSAPRRELQGPQMRPARPAPGEAAPVSRRPAAGEPAARPAVSGERPRTAAPAPRPSVPRTGEVSSSSGVVPSRASAPERERPRRETPAPRPASGTDSAPVRRPAAARQERPQVQPAPPTAPTPRRETDKAAAPRREHVVHSVDIPSITDDFFAKYNDPDYVNRRLKELQEEREKQQNRDEG